MADTTSKTDGYTARGPGEYHKLVRDKIPEVIVSDGFRPEVAYLSQEEFVTHVRAKVLKEAQGLSEAKTTKEIAEEAGDLYDIVDALLRATGVDRNYVDACRREKETKRGKFEKRLFLMRVGEKR